MKLNDIRDNKDAVKDRKRIGRGAFAQPKRLCNQ